MANHRKLTAIPVYIALVLIPQILFFWLAPYTAGNYFAVYIGLSLITAGISTTVFFLYLFCGLRRTAGAGVAGFTFEIAAGIMAVILFSFLTDIRSAIFAYLLLALVAFVFMFPLFCSAMNSRIDPPEAIIPQIREEARARNSTDKAGRYPPPVPPHDRTAR